jgi:hypothetical protein
MRTWREDWWRNLSFGERFVFTLIKHAFRFAVLAVTIYLGTNQLMDISFVHNLGSGAYVVMTLLWVTCLWLVWPPIIMGFEKEVDGE